MNRCFVIQPFDGDEYDSRFDDIINPALLLAGSEAYRVDRDPNVAIPIDDIEREISDARFCLADISTDNPNVWFELGYAIATKKDVVMICSEERLKFPFDVQHRSIIRYKKTSISTFEKLKKDIAERALAILKKEETIAHIAGGSVNAGGHGFRPHEVALLAVVASNLSMPSDHVVPHLIHSDMERAGYNRLATNSAIRSLRNCARISY